MVVSQDRSWFEGCVGCRPGLWLNDVAPNKPRAAKFPIAALPTSPQLPLSFKNEKIFNPAIFKFFNKF